MSEQHTVVSAHLARTAPMFRGDTRSPFICSLVLVIAEQYESKSHVGHACSRTATARSVGDTGRCGHTRKRLMCVWFASRVRHNRTLGSQESRFGRCATAAASRLETSASAKGELHGREDAELRTKRAGWGEDPSADGADTWKYLD